MLSLTISVAPLSYTWLCVEVFILPECLSLQLPVGTDVISSILANTSDYGL